MNREAKALVKAASSLVGKITLGRADMSARGVAAAILTTSGHTYTGVCVEVNCGMGFCAEHAAVAEMLKARETQIAVVVAVGKNGILPPCGRCREFMAQVNPKNFNARVLLPGNRVARLRALLPHHWINSPATPSPG